MAIARGYGYSSWSTLKIEVEQRQSGGDLAATVSIARGPETILTDRARKVIVMAHEEARLFNHGFIGTEHLLLGLAKDTEGLAAQVLVEQRLSLDVLRQQVEEIIGMARTEPVDSPPFTPRAKKVLELSLQEALDLGDRDIAPEHILLGLIAEGGGVATQILLRSGIDIDELCRTVEERIGATPRQPSARGSAPVSDRLSSRVSASIGGLPGSVSRAPQVVAWSFCGRRPPDSGRLVGGPQCHHL